VKRIGGFILVLIFSLAFEGCYTTIYTDVVYQDNYYPPPPPPSPPRPPRPPNPIPPDPIYRPTQPPERGTNNESSYGVRDKLRNHGGRNPGSRTPDGTIESRGKSKIDTKGENNR
jgi:hypothetical protein